jgi:Histidine kinase-, DNA gyrase B-, and HSP90-like ATPase
MTSLTVRHSQRQSLAMQSRAAGVALACLLAGAASSLAGLAVPRVTGALPPTVLDSVVPLALVGAALVLLRGRDWLAVTLLAGAAAVWSLTGMAGVLHAPLASTLPRLALLPHALVVVVLLSLPYGELDRARRAIAVAAVVVAALAGAGASLPVLALLGLLCVVPGAWSARPGRAPEAVAAGLVLVLVGAGWLLLWWATDRVPLRTVADGVDVVLLGSAVAVVLVVGRGRASGELGAELGKRVGAVVGLTSAEVRFPLPGEPGFVLDVDGRRLPPTPATAVVDEGTVVALISPPVTLTRGTERVLARRLAPLAEIAALNDSSRRRAIELDESRRRLGAAAAEERRRVEQALAGTVLHRLNTIEALLDESGVAYRGLGRVRRELSALVAGLDPLRGRTLGEALLSLRDRVTQVDANASLDAPLAVAQTAWWVVAEAVTNALKHAPDAEVVVRAARSGTELAVSVTDDGPGGADPRGSGLLGIADRAAVAGGRLDLESDGAGTTVRVVLPTGWPSAATRSAPDPLARQDS